MEAAGAWGASALLRSSRIAIDARGLPADEAARLAVETRLTKGALRQPHGLLAPERDVLDIAMELADAGVGPVSATRPDYVFEAACPAADALAARVGSGLSLDA